MNTLIAWGAKVAPIFIAVPMAIFGAQHFIYLAFVADFIPSWVPWRTFWACFTGAALLAAAAGIVFRVLDHLAAFMLGLMILSWVLLLHTSRIAAKPEDFGEWRGIFQALAMSGCAFVLATSRTQHHLHRPGPETATVQGIDQTILTMSRLAPVFLAVAMIGLGLEHLIFSTIATPQVPLWIPGPSAINILLGFVLITAGAGMALPRFRRVSSGGLGLLIFASMALVHLPVVVHSARFESDWTKTFVLSGGMLLLAASCRQAQGADGPPLLQDPVVVRRP